MRSLELDATFRDVSKLFVGSGSILQLLQCSKQLQAKFQVVQRECLHVRGSTGTSVQKVLRHFSQAQQRWEAHAEPQRRFCLLLVPGRLRVHIV